jgi:hypothetical protein
MFTNTLPYYYYYCYYYYYYYYYYLSLAFNLLKPSDYFTCQGV